MSACWQLNFHHVQKFTVFLRDTSHVDKKEKQIFQIYKEIQKGAVAKSYMTNSLLIYD